MLLTDVEDVYQLYDFGISQSVHGLGTGRLGLGLALPPLPHFAGIEMKLGQNIGTEDSHTKFKSVAPLAGKQELHVVSSL